MLSFFISAETRDVVETLKCLKTLCFCCGTRLHERAGAIRFPLLKARSLSRIREVQHLVNLLTRIRSTRNSGEDLCIILHSQRCVLVNVIKNFHEPEVLPMRLTYGSQEYSSFTEGSFSGSQGELHSIRTPELLGFQGVGAAFSSVLNLVIILYHLPSSEKDWMVLWNGLPLDCIGSFTSHMCKVYWKLESGAPQLIVCC